MTLEDETPCPRLERVQHATGEEHRAITNPERMKYLAKEENDTQLWTCLVVKVTPDARTVLLRNLECRSMNPGKVLLLSSVDKN